MAKILATETACLNSFGLGSNPADVNETQRLYFGNTLVGGDLHIVDDEFNILFTKSGIAVLVVLKYFLLTLCVLVILDSMR